MEPLAVGNKIQPPESLNVVEPDRDGIEGRTMRSTGTEIQSPSSASRGDAAILGLWGRRIDKEVGRASELERQQVLDIQD